MTNHKTSFGEKKPKEYEKSLEEKNIEIKELYEAFGEYPIQNEFIYTYGLEDVFINYEMKPNQKIINYTLVGMIYEDIDWSLYLNSVDKVFEEIWKDVGFDEDKKFPILDLQSMQFNLLTKSLNRRIFNYIYQELIKLTVTSLYKNNSKLKYEDKVKSFKKFIEDFNLNLTSLVEDYSKEMRVQLLIIKFMLGTNQLTIEEFKEKIKKATSLLGKNYNPHYIEGYREVFRRIDENKESNEKVSERQIAIDVSKIILNNFYEHEHNQFYKAFNKIKNKNNLKDLKDFEKNLQLF